MENGVHLIIVEGKKGTKLFDSRKAHLPELRPDLVTALSGLYVDDFTVIIKRERERETSEKFFLETTKRGKATEKKRAFCPSCVNVPRRPRREREKRERQRYSRATKTISYIFYDVNDEEERRTAWCLLWCSLQSNLRVKDDFVK